MTDRIVKNYINGMWVASKSENMRTILNPATNEAIAQVPLSTVAEVDKAVQAAQEAFYDWRTTPPYTRARSMFKFKNLLEEHFEELSRIVVVENGKTIDEARAELRRAIENDDVAVTALLDHPGVRAISFVGSSRVGKLIYERATRNGKRVQAQGGAKNYMVVMPDAVVPQTVGAVLGSAFGCAGQRCLAGSVLLTVGDVHKPVMDALTERASALKVGYGLDESSQMGPVGSQEALNRVCTHIERGQTDGARLALDGRATQVKDYPNGNFIGPTIFENAKPGMGIITDEIFGPVLSVMQVPDFDSAIETLELSAYGNGASIFTTNGRYGRVYAYRVYAGNIDVNIGVAAPIASFPFGGMKDSFFGDLH